MYADDLVMCGDSKGDLRALVGHFAEVYRGRSLKVNGYKNKMMFMVGRRDWSMRFA